MLLGGDPADNTGAEWLNSTCFRKRMTQKGKCHYKSERHAGSPPSNMHGLGRSA